MPSAHQHCGTSCRGQVEIKTASAKTVMRDLPRVKKSISRRIGNEDRVRLCMNVFFLIFALYYSCGLSVDERPCCCHCPAPSLRAVAAEDETGPPRASEQNEDCCGAPGDNTNAACIKSHAAKTASTHAAPLRAQRQGQAALHVRREASLKCCHTHAHSAITAGSHNEERHSR